MKKNAPGCTCCEEGPPTVLCTPCGIPADGDLNVAFTYRNFSNVVTTDQNTLVHVTTRPSWLTGIAPADVGHYWHMTARRQYNDANNFTFPWYRFAVWCSVAVTGILTMRRNWYPNNSDPDNAFATGSGQAGFSSGGVNTCDPLYLVQDCCNVNSQTGVALSLGVPMFQLSAP